MQIEILDVSKPYKDGKYFKMDVKYNRDGKDSSRKLVAVGDTKKVFEVIKDAEKGEVWDITVKQDGEYWNWVDATKAEKAVAASGGRVSKSTYETPEERAKKQLSITRQFAINASIAMGCGKPQSVADVLKTAQTFVDWVYQLDEPEQAQQEESVEEEFPG